MVDEQTYNRVMRESRENEAWEQASFRSWWSTYRAYHSADEYPEDAPKEVRQAFTAALVMLRERQGVVAAMLGEDG
jgi:hypothetical protein